MKNWRFNQSSIDDSNSFREFGYLDWAVGVEKAIIDREEIEGLIPYKTGTKILSTTLIKDNKLFSRLKKSIPDTKQPQRNSVEDLDLNHFYSADW